MAEWPKVIVRYPGSPRWVQETTRGTASEPMERVPVISADLGRELYEELKKEVKAQRDLMDREAVIGYDRNEPWPVEELLARYEREVGEPPRVEPCTHDDLLAIPPPTGLNVGICRRCGTVHMMDPDAWSVQTREVGDG